MVPELILEVVTAYVAVPPVPAVRTPTWDPTVTVGEAVAFMLRVATEEAISFSVSLK
jgi:hypothetical protein